MTATAPTAARPTETQHLLVLRAPSANRVYADAAGTLAVHEARRVLAAHLDPDAAVELVEHGGVPYLDVRVRAERPAALRILSTLSGVLGLFAPHPGPGGGSGTLLEPLDAVDPHRLPSDLETTLRYPGKTNEQFTALLLNLAAAASGRRAGLLDGTLRVLDPVCGRGTTLSRALRLGLSPVGADLDAADHDAYRTFLLTWLRTHRCKHTSSAGRLTVHGRVLGSRFDAEFARSKEAQRDGQVQTVTLLRCATEELGAVLPRAGTDALVADLPYGVQHGARAHGALHRSPLSLVAEAAPVWRSLLRRDAGLALAINRHTTPFDAASTVLADAGFQVVSEDGEYRHRVDQSIDRDVLVAIRTDHPQATEPAPRGSAPDERTP